MRNDFMRNYRVMEHPEARKPGGFKRTDKVLKYKKSRSKSVSIREYRIKKALLMTVGTIAAISAIGFVAYKGIMIFIGG